MIPRPNDRIKKSGTANGDPRILNSVDIKIPDKEIHLMKQDEQAPTGGGTCSCHSVCSCVPVSGCNCNMVCTCDAVCNTNTCACHPFTGCPTHSCNCQPVCSTCTTCSTTCTTCSTTCTTCSITCLETCTCIPVVYYYPN